MLQIKKGSAQMVMGAIAVSAVSALSMPTAASAAIFTLNNGNSNSGIFSTSGVIDTVNITTTGIYTIDAFGAQGGNSGGLGGEIKGNFNLTAGEILKILVGTQGKNGTNGGVAQDGGGGGGGTFVVVNGTNPLVIAGGGGGGGGYGYNGGGGGGFGGGGGGSYGGSSFTSGGFGGGGGGGGNVGGFGGSSFGYGGGYGGGFGSGSLIVGGNGGDSNGGGGIGGYDATQLATISSLMSNNAVRSGNGSLAISFVSASSTAVPEPFTIVGTLIGGGAALRMRKKLRDAAKCQRQ